MKNYFERIVSKLITRVFDKPLQPPTSKELELIEELKANFRDLLVKNQKDHHISGGMWADNIRYLSDLINTRNPREFLRWDVIRETMFVGNAEYISKELKFLKNLPDWENRWQNAIKESHVGHPPPYWRHLQSSGNLIHNAYHLAQFEAKTGVPNNSAGFVFEFGGGYGSLCRLFHNLNFSEKYVIFDLPVFSALQRFFLKSIGITVHSADSFKMAKAGVVCVSNLEQLKTIISNHIEVGNSMFIATWSMSETPVSLRESILPIILNFDRFLIAYQDKFEGVNNKDFFNNWMNTKNNNIKWYNWEIEHLPNNFYLVGKRVNR